MVEIKRIPAGVHGEHYEKYRTIFGEIDGRAARGDERVPCAVCQKSRVKVFGEACSWCIANGQAPNPKVRG